MSNYTYNDELYHWGVKGMKWGVRRYRDENGRLTEAGKKRIAKMNKKADAYYKRETSRYKKILDKPYKYSEKKIYNAKSRIKMSNKIDSLRRKEIKDGFDFVENRLLKDQWSGQFVLGIPGQLISIGTNYFAYKNEWDQRAKIEREYKDAMKAYKAKHH